jgi:hypothetical protein
MPRTVVTITSDLFDEAQEASVRENLAVRLLIEETIKEFNLSEEALYSLRQKGSGKSLDPDKSLEQQGITSGAELVFTRDRRAPVRDVVVGGGASRVMLLAQRRPVLIEESTRRTFEILFQPAIIGRPDHTNPASIEMLAVNLEPFEGAKSVSRYHARLTEEGGNYYLESLAEHNPAYLNGSMVRMGEKRRLENNDRIRVGQITLTFTLRSTGTGNNPAASQGTTT